MAKGLQENLRPPTGPHVFELNEWISCAPFERLLNMTILEASAGKATLTMPFYIDHAQGAGIMHGGALVSLADTAVAMAIKSVIAPPSRFVTAELQSRFLLPVTKGVVTAKAQVFPLNGNSLRGLATLYDAHGKAVMEFSSIFRVSKKALKNIKLEQAQATTPAPI